MASKHLKKGLQRSALSVALGVCLVSGVYAQSNANGSLFGRADAGSTVIIEDAATGVHREVSVQADGTYRVSSLPIGNYRVVMKRADGTEAVVENARVSVGTGTPVNFSGSSSMDTELGTIVVSGDAINPIDVSSVESNTIMTEAKIDSVPVQRTVTNVALLAPGTVRGDGRFGNLASFGGASVAENVYYVNGFNVTNIVTGTAFSQLPFEAIAEQQVKTGGYGAEFGRSLGGVVNIVTKRGTNDWQFGGNIFWEPKSMNSRGRFAYDPERDGSYTVEDAGDYEALRYNVYASGPIIKDTLFLYALFQGSKVKAYDDFEGGSSTAETDTPQGMLKLDWNISDNHLLELTAFRDTTKTDGVSFQNSDPLVIGGGSFLGTSEAETGGDNWIARWTGYLTDSFTLSAMYGEGKYSRGSSNSNSAGCPIIIDARSSAVVGPLGVQGCWLGTFIADPAAGDKRTSWRIDADWVIGDHTLRFGLDNEEFDTTDGNIYSGGGYWRYVNATPGTALTGNGVVPDGVTELARFRYYGSGGQFLTKNSAWYIEDSWQITDNFVAKIGIRNESFENLNALGGSFIEVNDTWAPRLGFAWDVNGDSTLKIFGNAGRYYIPVYSNTNVRLSGDETFTQQYFTFTSIDPVTGIPSGTSPVSDVFFLSEGGVPDPRGIVDNNLSPMYQDEFILGFQKQFTDNWSAGVRGVYRKLKSGMDDICNYYEPYYWALENGYTEEEADAIGSAVNHCFLTNPGQDLSANVDLHGDGQLTVVDIPGEALGFPKAKRTYKAVELFFEGNWDNFFLQGSYTWAKSQGNTEGYVKSDIGQDDAGITQDFDYPGLMEGAYGYLPNDRRHSIKIFGAYNFSEEWQVGMNALWQTGRPINCFGVYPADGPDTGAPNYGAGSFYCNADGDGAYPSTLHARGTSGRVPSVMQFDAQVVYTPNWAEGLKFRMLIDNIFDSKDYYRVQDIAEDTTRAPLSSYRHPRGFIPSRGVTFSVEYDF